MTCVQVVHSFGLERKIKIYQKKRSKPYFVGEGLSLPHQEPFSIVSLHRVESWDDAVTYTNFPCIVCWYIDKGLGDDEYSLICFRCSNPAHANKASRQRHNSCTEISKTSVRGR